MTATWRCWLAAELAAAALLAGCTLPGTEEQAHSAERRPPVVFVVFDEFPADDLLRPDGQHRRRAVPELREAGVDLHLVPERDHGVRLHLRRGAVDPRRPPAAAAHGDGRAQPQAEHLPRARPARIRGVQGGVGLGGVPAVHLPGSPNAATRRAVPAGGRRAAGTVPQMGRRDPEPAAAGLLLPPRADAARAVDLPPVGAPEQAGGGGPDPGPEPRRRVRRRGPARTRTTCATCSRWDTRTGWWASCCDRLERTGLLERALVVVTADHGYSFRVGVKSRRLISEQNVEEIAPVPLFVKAPGQMERRVNRSARSQHRHARDDRRSARHAGVLRAGRTLGVLDARCARGARSRCGRATSTARCESRFPI